MRLTAKDAQELLQSMQETDWDYVPCEICGKPCMSHSRAEIAICDAALTAKYQSEKP